MDSTVAEQFMFPGMPEVKLTKRVRSIWEEMKEHAAVAEKHGGLLTPALAAKAVGLSKSRMTQLIDSGILRSWEFYGRQHLCGDDLKRFVEMERKTGRPWTAPSTKDLMKASWEDAKETVAVNSRKK